MLSLNLVQRYAHQSGLKDLMVAEREIVLTYALQRLHEAGFLSRVAFKGGTCIRKMFAGSQSRFSMDLDFTALEEGTEAEQMILDLMEVFDQPFHMIEFTIANDQWRVTQQGLSWAVDPAYRHTWNERGTFELQVSNRERPTLPLVTLPQLTQSYFPMLPFAPASIPCLDFHEIVAEKIRACYQRQKVRDLYDLYLFATKPYNRDLVRRLVFIKLWQARDAFESEQFIRRVEHGAYDWDDLAQLLQRSQRVDPRVIVHACTEGYRFLAAPTPEEQQLARDRYCRERALHAELSDAAVELRAR